MNSIKLKSSSRCFHHSFLSEKPDCLYTLRAKAAPLSDMERQDFINTINELRFTIESLHLTIATLQRTIESLHDGEKRYKQQASEYGEKITDLSRQCEYLESLNKRHCKSRFSGKTLSWENRTENKKKGHDEEKQDYVDSSSREDSASSDKGEASTDASHEGHGTGHCPE